MNKFDHITALIEKHFNDIMECGRHSSHNYNDCIICSGLFRVAIIDKKYNIIAKFGRPDDDLYDDRPYRQCIDEIAVYTDAVKCGVSNFFCPYLKTVMVNGYEFFLFEKVEEVGEVGRFHELQYDTNGDDDEWMYDKGFLESYYYLTRRSLNRLAPFFEKHQLNDMHEGNFGWSKRYNHIVFTDYGGY